MKSLNLALCLGTACGLLSSALQAVEAGPELIRPAVAEALTNHPALLAAGARLSSARAATESVRTWADPMGSIGIMPASRTTRRDDGDIRYGLELPLPLTGKATAMRQAVRAGEAVRESEALMRRFMLEREISKAFIALALADALLESAAKQEGNARKLAEILENQLAAGRAESAPSIRARTELERGKAAVASAQAGRDAAARSLNILLRRDDAQPVPKLELPAKLVPLRDAGSISSMSAEAEPEHLMLLNEERRASLMAASTKTSRRPDFALFLEADQYSADGTPKQGAIGVKMSLPWFNRSRYAADLDRDLSAAEAARRDQAAHLIDVRSRILLLHGEAEAALREAGALRDEVLPRTGQTLAATQAAWQAGTGSLRDVLEADRMRGETQADLSRSLARYWTALYEMAPLAGANDIRELLAREMEQPKP